jgi:UDP-N-acetylmuramate-alanine ligase
VQFVPSLEETRSLLLRELRAGDVLLVLSAGDADQVSAGVLAALRERMRQDV